MSKRGIDNIQTTERAARWFRVSSDAQDESNQVAEVDGHIGARGYVVARTFQLHDVSASKGEQQAALDEALEDIRAGRYSVIVIAHSSRLDRRDVDVAEFYALSVRMAGGRIESVREPGFGQTDIGGRVLTLLAQHQNHEYSETLKGHMRAARERIAANGALDGRTPWGFASTGPKYARRLVPTDEARQYVPEIYRRVTGGQSLAQVARWLEAEGVAPAGVADNRTGRGKSGKWWPRTIGTLIRNPVYMGLRTDGNGQTVSTCEALVDASAWAAAGKALDGRPKRGPVLKQNRCALSGAARCWACSGPMYRIASGRAPHRLYYLRCSGTGPDRRSCGAPMIRLDTAEALADQVLGGLRNPVREITTVPGNEAEIDAALASLDYERRQVALRGLSWADEDSERARIRAQYELAASTPRIPATRTVMDTGITYGERWAKMGTDARADWLRSGELTVLLYRGEVPGEDYGVAGTGGMRDGVSLILVWHDEDETAAA